MTRSVELNAFDLHWLGDEQGWPDDQCAHGSVELKAGDVVLVGRDAGHLTLSGAALHLLRTIDADHGPDHSAAPANLLFPCCAFNAWPDGVHGLLLVGCPNGVDVVVEHLDGESVRLTRDETTLHVASNDWRMAVVGFARQIEAFYAASTPKIPPGDEFDRKGWELFWSEWRTLVARHSRV